MIRLIISESSFAKQKCKRISILTYAGGSIRQAFQGFNETIMLHYYTMNIISVNSNTRLAQYWE